jgi:hypothetical protein
MPIFYNKHKEIKKRFHALFLLIDKGVGFYKKNIMDTNFHMGKLIRAELDRQEHTVAWLARKIQCERTNCYYIFERQFVDVDLLKRISIALKHNFFREMADYYDGVIMDLT